MKTSLKLALLTLSAATLFSGCSLGATTNSNTAVQLKDGDLIQYGTTIFVFAGGEVHGITTPDVLTGCNYDASTVKVVEQTEFDQLTQGEIVNTTANCPGK